MGLIEFIILCVVIGFALFLFNRFAPVEGNIKSLINYIVVFVLCVMAVLMILRLFGIYEGPSWNRIT